MFVKSLWVPSHKPSIESKSFQKYSEVSVENGVGFEDCGGGEQHTVIKIWFIVSVGVG